MKKLIAFCSSLLVLAGLKAQTVQVKKETLSADTVQQVKASSINNPNAASNKAFKEFKYNSIKKAATVKDMKELKVVNKDYIKH